MQIIRGKPLPEFRTRYEFDLLKHGDAIVAPRHLSAKEVFRRWKKRHPERPHARLKRSLREGEEHLLYFIEEPDLVTEGKAIKADELVANKIVCDEPPLAEEPPAPLRRRKHRSGTVTIPQGDEI